MNVSITANAADPRILAEGFLDGSGPKFDLLMRGFPEDAIINPGVGDFLTTGSLSYNEALGWFVKDGWKTLGDGMEQTIVRRISFPTSATPISHAVFQMDMYAKGNVELADFTVEGNWQNLGADKANASSAVNLVGNNCKIRRVRANGFHGDNGSLREAFVLAILASHNRVDGWEHNTGGLIEECEVTGSDIDYAIAIALLGGADGMSGSVQGFVRKNTVKNFIGTAAFGFGSNVILEENEANGCRQGFYFDTGVCENTTIRRNRILNNIWQAIHIAPSMGAARVSNLLIENNDIELSGTTPHDAGIQIWSPLGRGHLSKITIRGNHITALTPGTLTGISAQNVDILTIEDNVFDDGMVARINFPDHPNQNLIVRRNRTVSGAIIPGLEDNMPANPNPTIEEQLTAIEASLTQQATLITTLKQQLTASTAATARLQSLVGAIQAASTANLEKLSAP